MWSHIEINVAITCASVLVLRPLSSKVFGGSPQNHSNTPNRDYRTSAASKPRGASKLFPRSSRSDAIQLDSRIGQGSKQETVVQQQEWDSNSEEMILGGPQGILRTVETQVKTEDKDEDPDPLPERRSRW